MKLLYRITIRLSLALLFILSCWAVFFYFAMMEEIHDEVDDSLEDYSESVIIRALTGQKLPSESNGSNNFYYLKEITAEEARIRPQISYNDSTIYLKEKEETEPARILTTIFKDKDDTYFELIVATPSIEKKDIQQSILYWIIFLYLALLIIIIIINIWVFYKSMSPLYVLLRWLDSYKIGQKNIPLINNTRITEFRKLNDAALRNARRAEEQFEQQKQFIGNASHEIQTPLAVCRNRLEMLAEDNSLSEKNLGEIIKTLQTLEYISRLNKSLLLLTKIENRQFTDIRQIELNEIIKRYIDDYREIYEYKRIDIHIEEKDIMTVSMNESLAVVLITNLLKNAYVHNNNKGRIHIYLYSKSLTICNTGADKELDKEHIFERFYQGKKKEGSTGLGLAIAESICRLYGLHIRYYYEKGEHCFEIKK
ncbi:MAG: two-component sensor histidine kinase [Coprobacter sp.]|jgi:sensor histidine kinase|nr:HAMP domain-containing histidine kinase [Barnesiella sp. GGCC_0306]MBS7039380.1 HAMP domain-containing histidine kinase [Bacteroidales bacterium]PWM90980.1 MAG: two-component sensor histidine kinase [Coprobacter sp.]